MLNRKSNDAPACAGIGAAQSASPRMSPEIRNERCFILTSLHERTGFVNSKRDATSLVFQAHLEKSRDFNKLGPDLPAAELMPVAADRVDLSPRVDGRDLERTALPMADPPRRYLGIHRMGISVRMAYLPHRCVPDSPVGALPAGGAPGPPAVTGFSFMKEGRSMTTSRILGWVVTVTVALILATTFGETALAADPYAVGTGSSAVDLSAAPGAALFEGGWSIPLMGARPAWFSAALEQQVLAAGGMPVAAPTDAPLPSEVGIRPGAWMISPYGCTMNFVFTRNGAFAIGTAGHCVDNLSQH